MDRGTLSKFRDRSGDTRGGLGRVGGPSRRSGTGRRNLEEVRDGLGELPKVLDGSGDPPEGPGRFGGPSGRFRMDLVSLS